MDDQSYEREKTTNCPCGRAVYSQHPVTVGRGNGTLVTLEGAFVLTCLYCGSQCFMESTTEGMYRYQLRGQSFWERLNELAYEQWDSRFDPPLKSRPIQESIKAGM